MRLRRVDQPHEEIFLRAGENPLGRGDDNYAVLPRAEVSLHHAVLRLQDTALTVEDLGSTNGTFVNGRRISPQSPVPVEAGDRLGFGGDQHAFEVLGLGNGAQSRTKSDGGPRVFTVGRAIGNDLVIDSPVVSATHLLVTQDGRDGWVVSDPGSANGTFLGSPGGERVDRFALVSGQVLYLGNYRLPADRLITLLQDDGAGHRRHRRGGAEGTRVVVGRDPASDLPIDHPTISWHHAALTCEATRWVLEDLGSTNGSFVNGRPVTSPAVVSPGDEIMLGIFAYRLVEQDGGPVLSPRSTLQGLTLEARGVTRIVGAGLRLLDEISFTVHPGELVGLMGLSGAGKTTLIRALNGNDPPTEGSSSLNGLDIRDHRGLFRAMVGYVPQDDIVHPELTVYEALEHYARLRLPSDTRADELRRRIDDTLSKLGLSGVGDTLIGSPETEKGISGGQRKRVNLAMELLADPKVIFLDEPTSGLSAVDAKMVMELLRRLADEGKVILITIHQPSLDNYRIMDSVIVLSYGKLAYYGPAYPDSIAFFNPAGHPDLLVNPDHALIGLHEGEVAAGEVELHPVRDRDRKGAFWRDRYRSSDYHREYVVKRGTRGHSLEALPLRSVSGGVQFRELTHRFLRVKLKDRANTAILLAQAPIIALMVALLFSESAYWGTPELPPMAPTLFFVLSITAVWFGAVNSSREIVAERAILARERMVGVKVAPYLASKVVVLALLCLVQSVVLVSVVVLFAAFDMGLDGGIPRMTALVFLTSLAGLGIGLLVSALARSQAQALAVIPVILLPMIIFGGGILSVRQMSENPNPIAFGIAQIMPTRWSVQEMVRTFEELNPAEEACHALQSVDQGTPAVASPLDSCLLKRRFLDARYGRAAVAPRWTVALLVLFALLPIGSAAGVLARRYRA